MESVRSEGKQKEVADMVNTRNAAAVVDIKRNPKPTPLDREIEQNKLLEEMATYFVHLEHMDVWPEAVRQHCHAWASLMGLELTHLTEVA